MKQKIIDECRKYGYELNYIYKQSGYEMLTFINESVREELKTFNVCIDYELEQVSMYIVIDMGSFNEALESNINDEADVMDNIKGWLSKENLKSIEEWIYNQEEM